MDCQPHPPPQTTDLSINSSNNNSSRHTWFPKNGRQSSAFVNRGQTVSGRKCNKSNDKRSRTSFNQHQLRLLEEAFRQTNYPNQVYRDQLAADIELDPARVQIWFQNRRAKMKKQLAGKVQCVGCRHQAETVTNLIDQQLQVQRQIQAQSASNLVNQQQQQQLYLPNSSNETALDLHLSSHNNSSLSSRSSSSDDLYQEPSISVVPSSLYPSNEFLSATQKMQANCARLGTSNQQHQSEQTFYYSPSSEAFVGGQIGEQQGVQVYQQQQQQPGKILHQIYLPRVQPPPPHQAQLFSLQQSQQQQEQQQDEVSEFSRMLNSELGRALYCATTNQQRQQPNRQVFYQQHFGLDQSSHSQIDQYVRY